MCAGLGATTALMERLRCWGSTPVPSVPSLNALQELRDKVAEKEAAKAKAEGELRAAEAAHAAALEEGRRKGEEALDQVRWAGRLHLKVWAAVAKR